MTLEKAVKWLRTWAHSDGDKAAADAVLAALEQAQARVKRDGALLRECIKTRGELGKRALTAKAREAKLRECLDRIERRISEGQGSQPWCSCEMDLRIVREERAALAEVK